MAMPIPNILAFCFNGITFYHDGVKSEIIIKGTSSSGNPQIDIR